METQEILNLPIGEQDRQVLSPAKVKITQIQTKDKKLDGTPMQTPLAEIMCKHPDREELIPITKVKLEKNGKLTVVSTWVQLSEEEGKQTISKSSALAGLMNYLDAKTLSELYGKEADAIEQATDNKFLCLKAY